MFHKFKLSEDYFYKKCAPQLLFWIEKNKSNRFGWFLTKKINFESQILAHLKNCHVMNSKSGFLWVCWFFAKYIQGSPDSTNDIFFSLMKFCHEKSWYFVEKPIINAIKYPWIKMSLLLTIKNSFCKLENIFLQAKKIKNQFLRL
jgi:hypothetical protein